MFRNFRRMHRGLMLALAVILASGGLEKVAPVCAEEPEFRVNTTTEGTQTPCHSGLNQAVAMDRQGNFVVVWEGNGPGDDAGVFAQRFNANGEPQGQEFRVNTTTDESQENAKVAMAGDGSLFAVSWHTYWPRLGCPNTVYCRVYDSSGTALTGEVEIITGMTLTTNLAIAMDQDGDFIVTYRYVPSHKAWHGFYAQRFNAQGQPVGVPIRIGTWRWTRGDAGGPVAMHPDGDFVIGWHREDNDSVLVQRYDSSGKKVGAEIEVASFATGPSAIGMDAVGNFVVAWKDTNLGSILYRLYNADGTPKGEVFSAAATDHPSMAMDRSGNFALAWQTRLKPDPDDPATWHWDVYAQRFDDGGAPRGDPFVVNTTAAEDQYYPSVATNADGQFVFAWCLFADPDPYDPDTWDWDVYARRYSVTPEPGVSVAPTSGLVTSEDGGTAEFAMVLDSEPAAEVTIGVSSGDTSEGTVSDFSLAFDSTNWAQPQTVTVTGVDDTEADGDIPYTIVLASVTSSDPNYNGLDPSDVSVTNLDNDGAQPECSLAIDDVSQKEGDGGPTIFTFTVTRSGDASGTVTVGFATADGTATLADNDYLPNVGTLVFSPNCTSQTIDVLVVGDPNREPHETFAVGLFEATGGATIADGQGIGTIRNDDH